MPYQKSKSLPGEYASKLGHLSITKDPFIREVLDKFRKVETVNTDLPIKVSHVEPVESDIKVVIALDGSLTTIPNSLAEHKTLSYVKIAGIAISISELDQAQQPIVNPVFVREILSKNATTYSTVLPLANVIMGGKSLFHSIRQVLKTTFDHFMDGEILKTLNYLVSRQWKSDYDLKAHFKCPLCGKDTTVPRNQTDFSCKSCSGTLSVVDYLGLLQEVNEESNDDQVAFSLMSILEHLLLFSYIRQIAELGDLHLSSVLFVKDGPLMLRGQYSRLVDPMREYISHLQESGRKLHLVGIEKTGAFIEHMPIIEPHLEKPGDIFIPDNGYILKYIKHSGTEDTVYGERVLYGAKVYTRTSKSSVLCLTVPTGRFRPNANVSQLINVGNMIPSLARLQSSQFSNALLPIVVVNKLASMSFYPSNNILEKFTESLLKPEER